MLSSQNIINEELVDRIEYELLRKQNVVERLENEKKFDDLDELYTGVLYWFTANRRSAKLPIKNPNYNPADNEKKEPEYIVADQLVIVPQAMRAHLINALKYFREFLTVEENTVIDSILSFTKNVSDQQLILIADNVLRELNKDSKIEM